MALSKRLRPVSGSFRYPMMPSKMDPRRQLKRGSITIFKMSLPVQNHSMLLPWQNLEYSKVLWCFVILHLCATLPQLWPLHPYFTKYEQNICELIEKNTNHKSRYDWCTTDPISIVMFIYTIIYSIKRCSRYVPFWKNDHSSMLQLVWTSSWNSLEVWRSNLQTLRDHQAEHSCDQGWPKIQRQLPGWSENKTNLNDFEMEPCCISV